MGLTTIQWTSYRGPDGTMLPGYTFNPWIGCTKVQPEGACRSCYAETEDKRRGWTNDGWGPGKPRYRTSESNWKNPPKWNREAERAGVRPFVFCASLADVFDGEVPDEWRKDLFNLIWDTPHLTWLLLTKRPGLALRWQHLHMANGLWAHNNAWVGYSAGTQKDLDAGANALLQISAPVRFLSLEPLLELIDVGQLLTYNGDPETSGAPHLARMCGVDWIVCGGESGHKARPMHPDWARSLRNQCNAARVPFHFKQWGEYRLEPEPNATWADGTPVDVHLHPYKSERVGKKLAGRILDGRTWDEFPEVTP